MSNLKFVNDDDEFDALLKVAGDDLVIIDFFTTWCRPCRTMEPVFEAMAMHYPKAMFLKVDADKCFNTAMNYKVTGVPFFVIYFNKSVVETIQGANPQELELKIRLAEIESRKASAAIEQTANLNNKLAAHVNPVISTFGKLGSVNPYIDPENSHCLNDLSPTSFHNFIGGKKLISGRGTGKILLVYSFTQKMMLQSFKIRANPQTGPRVLRFFVNHPKVLDFNVGTTLAPSQEVTLSHHDLTGDRAIELRSGSFQVVTNVQIFVISGQSKNSRIEIDTIQLFGAPVLAIQPLLAVDSMMKPPSNNNTLGAASSRKKCDSDQCAVDGTGEDADDDESLPSQSAKSLEHPGSSPGGPSYHGHHHHHHDNHHRRSHGSAGSGGSGGSGSTERDHHGGHSKNSTSEGKRDSHSHSHKDHAEDKHSDGHHSRKDKDSSKEKHHQFRHHH